MADVVLLLILGLVATVFANLLGGLAFALIVLAVLTGFGALALLLVVRHLDPEVEDLIP